MARHHTVSLEFRQKIVDALLRRESISGVARRFQFPYSTVYSIWKRYKEEGDIAAGQRGGARRQSRLNEEHLGFLVGVIGERPGATLAELKEELQTNFPGTGDIALSTLGKALEDRAHMTLKRLSVEHSHHNSPETIAARQQYAHRFRLEGKTYSDVIFFDEAGFNLHMTRSRGHAVAGQRARQQHHPHNRERNVSLLVAADRTGIRAHRTITGAWNSAKLIDFFNEEIFPRLDGPGQHATFVMDNAHFHHNRGFLDLVAEHGHQVDFLPPYSPWLNIAENVFAKVKPVVTRQELVNHNGLVNVINATINTVTAEDCNGWIHEATCWLAVAEAGHPLGRDHDAATAIQRFNV
ncbi:uncharacterized protein UTRI_10169 [Ustilago trichophora]|uniref:Uncharacterized protein n=1 Tax=Ustilago trichophora TaxID=86804 RepID=A0A5C3EF38_9BASI|nr:uncharacterized protein UTRI_10169 [Ustilago trichophora]